jgi:fatty acid desaturase
MSVMKRFYTDPYLQIRYFSILFLVASGACAGLISLHSQAFYHYHFNAWHMALIPLGIYIGGLSAVFIHNATHDSFRPRWLNTVCGELAGMHQLWGFMGWKLIHLVHHHYSDDEAMDPHPPKNLSYWKFTRIMFRHSSAKITERYQEHWGDTPRTQRLQVVNYAVFLALAASNLVLWFLLLGPVGFLWFYIPSYITNHLLFSHINYYAHPKEENGGTAPGNLNYNMYYKLANFFWFGIYFHGNHHRKPKLFNPRYMPMRARIEEQHKAAA